MTLEVACASMGGHVPALESWQHTATHQHTYTVDITTHGEHAGFLAKCQKAYEESKADVIGYLHADLTIHEQGWDERVLREFEWPTVAVVGFVGATQLGHDDIYKIGYDYRQLARGDVWSNLTDAEAHGQRDVGSRPVAVLDSCAIFVRRSFLQRVGGWPIGRLPNTSHCTDLWICATAHRLGRQVRMVGVSATHASGGKGESGSKWLDARGGDDFLHKQAHVATYELLRSVLPLRVR
jgi:hypothetical protein